MDINQKPTAIESHAEWVADDTDTGRGYWKRRLMALLGPGGQFADTGATDAELMAATGKTRNVVSGLRRALEIEGLLLIKGAKQDAGSGRTVNIYAINPSPQPLNNSSARQKITAIQKEIQEWQTADPTDSTNARWCRMWNTLNRIKNILKDA